MTLFPAADEPEAAAAPATPDELKARRRSSAGWILLVIAFLLLLLMIASPAPYVIEQPGPVFNTLGTNQQVWPSAAPQGTPKPLISIPDKKTYPTSGSLDLLTVSMLGDPQSLPSWAQVIGAWFDPDKAVLPLDAAFPPGQSVSQQNSENAQLMTDSQQDAIAAALNELGYRFPQDVVVAQVIPGTPAAGVVKQGDIITSVNGQEVKGVASLRSLISDNGTSRPAVIGIERDGEKQAVHLTPHLVGGAATMGVGVTMKYDFPFEVQIELNNVGGPSAGQMFALGIIDKLSPGQLNGGDRVAGTGTIDNEGNIGPIGGIRQKMAAARAAGATWFLAPAANCDEVTGHVPAGLHVYAVKTLHDSLRVMAATRSGNAAGLPTCPAR